VGIVGHVETPTLATGVDAVAAREVLEALTLVEVKALLDHAIARRDAEAPDAS